MGMCSAHAWRCTKSRTGGCGKRESRWNKPMWHGFWTGCGRRWWKCADAGPGTTVGDRPPCEGTPAADGPLGRWRIGLGVGPPKGAASLGTLRISPPSRN